MPIVSVVVPVHNREDLLPETLDSVLSQTFIDWECIIVDDHSTDGSLAVAENYTRKDNRFCVVSLPDTKRYANAARNYGMSLARGEFVNFLDSDDLFLPDKLQIQLNEFMHESALDAVTCQHAIIGEGKIRYLKFAEDSFWLDVAWYPDYFERYGGLWCTNGPLWRKTSILSIRGWDERLMIFQDVELNVRAILAGLQIKRVEQVLVYVQDADNNRTTSPSINSYSNLQKSVLIAWKLLQESAQITELRRRMVALRLLFIARWFFRKGQFIKGGYMWISGSLAVGLNIILVIHGVIQFVGMSRYFEPITRYLRPALFGHLKDLPDGISSLESM